MLDRDGAAGRENLSDGSRKTICRPNSLRPHRMRQKKASSDRQNGQIDRPRSHPVPSAFGLSKKCIISVGYLKNVSYQSLMLLGRSIKMCVRPKKSTDNGRCVGVPG